MFNHLVVPYFWLFYPDNRVMASFQPETGITEYGIL
ncbi:hypothetical protein BMETH_1507_0 [methanotrophic bacterial endosymbiont of Bathymodiolus sp.]|nr:hypothetical protein BMETH_1507_0 [methanotrophic bacterial endosymbiont of Bathymodiolus sp.]